MMKTTHRGNPLITLIVTCLGTFMVLLDGSIVTLALPTIQSTLHAHLSDLQWTIDAYTLPFAALLLTAGTLGDRFGRKRLFLSGLVLFLLGSTLCGLASTLGWLIFGRVVQGTGGAALSPGSLSLLATAFPEPRQRAKMIGIWSGISGLALAAGPLAGGLLIGVASWPAIFFVNLPVGVIALVLGWPGLAESRNPAAQRIDLPGQVLVVGALVCLIMALIESSSAGWTSPLILGLFLAQYFQAVQGATALEAGLQTLPITVGTFLIAPVAGQLTARTSPRLPTTLGALLASGALFLLLDLSPTSSFASLWWKLGILGVGIGFMFSPLTVAVLSATPAARSGLASSLVSTGRQIGSTLGVAVLGAFVLQQFTGNIASQLTQRGVPGSIATTIAGKIGSAGAQASQVRLPGQLPLSPTVLHQAIGQAFVDALHGSFLISAITMLVTALFVLFIFPSKQRTTTKSVEAADPVVPTVARDVQYEML